MIWSLVSLPFLNPTCTSGSSQFTNCWSLTWRILSITLVAWEMSVIVQSFEHSLVLPFLGTGMKADFFQSCGYCWVFQICWHIEHNTLMPPSFRILNSSAGIKSFPLALLIECFLKPTSHSRMPGSGWVTTPSWLSGSLRSFLYLCVFLLSLLHLFCFYFNLLKMTQKVC